MHTNTGNIAQVALVTGCSSGLGRALASSLHSKLTPGGNRKYTVYASARKVQALQDLADQGIKTLELDVASDASVTKAIEAIVAAEGKIDVVVNNAGALSVGPIAEQPLKDLQALFDVNVFGAVRVVQAAMPHFAKQGSGLVVNVGSVSAGLVTPFGGAYSASKAALHNLTQALRMEVEPLGVKVMLVQAGAIKSSLADKGMGHSGVERYYSPASLYHAVADKIKARINMSQQIPGIQSAEQVAEQVAAAMGAKEVPDRVLVAGKAGDFTFLGLLQTYLAPWYVKVTLVKRFGLLAWKPRVE